MAGFVIARPKAAAILKIRKPPADSLRNADIFPFLSAVKTDNPNIAQENDL
jgi:hypothetical protein